MNRTPFALALMSLSLVSAFAEDTAGPLAPGAQGALGAALANAGADVGPPSGERGPVAMRPLWELGVGVAALRLPDYRGSDHSSTIWLPLPYAVYRGKWLRADREGARAVLLDTHSMEIDLSVAGAPPSRSKNNTACAGMPDLQAAFEVGPNVNYTLARSDDRKLKLDLRLPVRAAFTVERSPQSIGATFSPNLNLDMRGVAGGWNLGVLGGPLFADHKYHNHIYGVDAAYATPGRAAYRAPGGYAGWQALVSVSRRFESMWFGAFMRYDNLRGAAFADSPLVRSSSALTMGFGVSWVLGTSSELVAVPD